MPRKRLVSLACSVTPQSIAAFPGSEFHYRQEESLEFPVGTRKGSILTTYVGGLILHCSLPDVLGTTSSKEGHRDVRGRDLFTYAI